MLTTTTALPRSLEAGVVATAELDQPLLDRLKRMGISGWDEPLLCLPKRYLDYSNPTTLHAVLPRDNLVAGTNLFSLVVSECPVLIREPRKMIRFTATDGRYSVRITVFVIQGTDTRAWMGRQVGSRIHLRGVLQSWGGRLQITGPELVPEGMIGMIVPVYEKRRGIVAEGAIFDATRHALRHHIDETVDRVLRTFSEQAENQILKQARLTATSLRTLLITLHQPRCLDEAELALQEARRLAAYSVVDNARRLKQRTMMPQAVVKIPAALLAALVSTLPHPLTNDQKKTLREIVIDLALPFPMRRVISGDVGCGKTITFMIPALAVQRMGLRAVVLTPNSLLADQFLVECRRFFGEDAPVVLVTAGTKSLDLKGNPVLVGTTALLNRLRNSPAPALLAVDEQQKFSVAQKQALSRIETNFLEATATPIPRTTALITHGAMDVSIIREMPVARNIVTRIVHASEAARLYSHTQRVIAAGGQVAIVYPIVADAEQEKKSVRSAFEVWSRKFPGQVGMIHGAMREDDKIAATNLLKNGKHKIGIVSSVIEIGLTIPALKSAVVVNAERYGTSTLHQLRGRVARLGGNGYFFLFLPDPVSAKTLQRLQLLEQFSDGFTLSEHDAQIRGYGDLFENAERQHGNSRSTLFHCADLRPEDLQQFVCGIGG